MWSTTSAPATVAFRSPPRRPTGARGVGIDIDPQRIREATENLKTAGVGDRVKFLLNQDLFTTDISEAPVVTLYLLPSLNLKLLPILNKQLKPRPRVVSHAFDMAIQATRDAQRQRADRLFLDDSHQSVGFLRPVDAGPTPTPRNAPIFPTAQAGTGAGHWQSANCE